MSKQRDAARKIMQKNSKRKSVLLAALFSSAAIAAVSVPQLALAQDDENDNTRTDVIIVEALRRQQSIQEVPMSVSAVTGETLEQIGAENLADYASTVPGLIVTTAQPGFGTILIRGVSDGILGGEGGATTGLYIDEMPITSRVNNPDLKLFDLERVEVLRGPQGTLYGVNSMGGTLRIVTAKPKTDRFEGAVGATLSTTKSGGEGYNVNGMVNIPLIKDLLAVRAVGYYYDQDGWIDDIGLGEEDTNDEQTWGGRVSIRFTPTDNFTVTGAAIHQEQELGGIFSVNPDLDSELLTTRALAPEDRDENFTSYNGTIKWDTGPVQFVSSTSFFERDGFTADDQTEFILGALGGTFPGQSTADNVSDRDVFAQEVRLASTHGGPVEWLIGGFYMDEDVVSTQCFNTENGEQILRDNMAEFAILPESPDCVFQNMTTSDFSTVAAFGELGFNVTDRLSATVGARWFNNKETVINSNNGLVAFLFFGGPSTSTLESEEDDINLRFSLSYDVSEDVLLYAQAAEGFRQGGVSPAAPDRPETPFTSDSLWNYEFGVKTSTPDGRLTANAAIYWIDWTDIQTQLETPSGAAFIDNLGSATIVGFEAEFNAQPTDRLQLSGSVNIQNPEFDENQPLVPIAGMQVDISKGQLPGIPRFTTNAIARYTQPVTSNFDGIFQADLRYIGTSFAGPGQFFSTTRQGDYFLANLRAGLQTETWDLTFFVNNVANERARVLSSVIPALGFNEVFTNQPRSFGVTFNGRF